jgi:hypothetical protein
MKRFRGLMDARHPDWEIALIISKINLYYFTGTIQDGILLIPRTGECFWAAEFRTGQMTIFPLILPQRAAGCYRDFKAIRNRCLETEQVRRFHSPGFQKPFHSGFQGLTQILQCPICQGPELG